MTILNSREYLTEKLACLKFLDCSVLDNVVKKLSTTCILHDNPYKVLVLEDINHAYDVRMVQELHQANFTVDADFLLGSLDVRFLDDLDSNLTMSRWKLTLSLVRICSANFTLPKVPFPSVLMKT